MVTSRDLNEVISIIWTDFRNVTQIAWSFYYPSFTDLVFNNSGSFQAILQQINNLYRLFTSFSAMQSVFLQSKLFTRNKLPQNQVVCSPLHVCKSVHIHFYHLKSERKISPSWYDYCVKLSSSPVISEIELLSIKHHWVLFYIQRCDGRPLKIMASCRFNTQYKEPILLNSVQKYVVPNTCKQVLTPGSFGLSVFDGMALTLTSGDEAS